MKNIFFMILLGMVFVVGCGDDDTTDSTIDPIIGNWNQTYSGETTCEEGGCSAMTYSDPTDGSCGPYSTFAQNNTFTYNECCLNDQTNAVTCAPLFYGTWEVSGSSYILTAVTIDASGNTLAEIVDLTLDTDGTMDTLHDHCTIDHPLIENNCLGARFIKGTANVTACSESCTTDG